MFKIHRYRRKRRSNMTNFNSIYLFLIEAKGVYSDHNINNKDITLTSFKTLLITTLGGCGLCGYIS